MKQKKAKNKKLMIQVVLLLLPIIAIMSSVMLYIVYNSTVNGFLDGKNELISDKLNSDSLSAFFSEPMDTSEGWFFEYFREHPEILSEPITEEEQRAGDAAMSSGSYGLIFVTRQELEGYDPVLRSFAAKEYYNLLCKLAKAMADDEDFDCAFMTFAPENGDPARIIYSIVEGEIDADAVAEKRFDYSEHPKVEDALEKNTDDIVFERTDDFMLEGDYYIGYKPIIVDGKIAAVVGLAYNWSGYSSTMSKIFGNAFVLAMIDVLVAGAALAVLLYITAIRPVGKIEHSVSEYMDTKDSSAVKERMSEVKVRNEIGRLSDKITDLAVEIDSYMDENMKLVSEKKRIDTELELATSIQASQLPSEFPPFPDRHEFEIFASMTPAKEVGGDFYDFFFLDDDHLAMVIADVSGKGVPASLFMMMTKMLINEYAMISSSPKEIMERVNQAICRNNTERMFVTVWLGILEISTGRLTSSNAGHECPVIRQPGGSFEVFKSKHDFVLGGFEHKKFTEREMTLEHGATLFVYTDGVPEATNADNEFFGMDRLVEVLNREPDAAPEQLLNNVHSAVNEFVGDAPQFDDLTMLGIRFR